MIAANEYHAHDGGHHGNVTITTIECPWTTEEDCNVIDLKGKSLTAREKLYIGQQMVLGKQTSTQLRIKYNLHINSIKYYKKQYTCGKVPHSRKGRPRALDEAAFNAIEEVLRTNQHLSEQELRQMIREKHRESWNSNNTVEYKKLSKRTVVRYSALLREKVNYCNSDDLHHAADSRSSQQYDLVVEPRSSSSIWQSWCKFFLG